MKQNLNILITGTSYWNPGDDFVRQGVMNLLIDYFKKYYNISLNFFLYNFIIDDLKLDNYRIKKLNFYTLEDFEFFNDFDFVIVVGLPIGNEILRFYEKLLEYDLVKRTILIGGGYDSQFLERHFLEHSDFYIEFFSKLRGISTRTKKIPKSFENYSFRNKIYYIPCPAFLVNYNFKGIKYKKKKLIKRVAFSIQTHEKSRFFLINQHAYDCYEIICLRLIDFLIKNTNFDIKIICHHKYEFYNYYQKFNPDRINLSFDSEIDIFKRKYYDVDLIFSTRLHSCIYGISNYKPAILINNTSRHIETLKDIPFIRIIKNDNDCRKFILRFQNFIKFICQKDYFDKISRFKNQVKINYFKFFDRFF